MTSKDHKGNNVSSNPDHCHRDITLSTTRTVRDSGIMKTKQPKTVGCRVFMTEIAKDGLRFTAGL